MDVNSFHTVCKYFFQLEYFRLSSSDKFCMYFMHVLRQGIYSHVPIYVVRLPCILGYENDEVVDEVIFRFFSTLSTTKRHSIFFNFNPILLDIIHQYFLKFRIERYFRHESMLIYSFLCFQWEFLSHIQLQRKGL